MYKAKVRIAQVTHGAVMKSYQGSTWVTLYENGKPAKFETAEEAQRFIEDRLRETEANHPGYMEKVIETKAEEIKTKKGNK